MAIDYRENDPSLPLDQLADLYRGSGLDRPVDDHESLQRMLRNADVLLSAWDGDALVGVARALTDFSVCCYLADLVIAKSHQGQGIGRELVQRLRSRIGDEIPIVAVSRPEATGYFPRLGFHWVENAWRLPRRK